MSLVLLVLDKEILPREALVLTADSVADLLVLSLLDRGFIGLWPFVQDVLLHPVDGLIETIWNDE